ncbi:hypothetical protein NDU88_004012 [Pleurodeles waltl]|uniref:Uncharacterized protein n=1 Tax=Pleurodeles waltl TaxID=8319 RepID=A0AAV7MSA0_PLEWA|nr:hypothetical protein NDU88_004012 [Pleurodeles waltl]
MWAAEVGGPHEGSGGVACGALRKRTVNLQVRNCPSPASDPPSSKEGGNLEDVNCSEETAGSWRLLPGSAGRQLGPWPTLRNTSSNPIGSPATIGSLEGMGEPGEGVLTYTWPETARSKAGKPPPAAGEANLLLEWTEMNW